MQAIHTETIERNGTTYRINIYPDPDSGNPIEEWDYMGKIMGLNRSTIEYDPSWVEDALENNPDAVPLSCYEHGGVAWSVRGESHPMHRCPFDSVDVAGVWIPDDDTLDEAKKLGGRTRRLFMLKRARSVVETYNQWVNGEVYGYTVDIVTECDDCDCPNCPGEHTEQLDSCWGFFGFDFCLESARESLPEETAASVA